ncbi:MAG: aminopeptidase P family protein [Calditrichaeota bacterium]|nr:MAG: aminopeptidase P family protein [Calditrichota bacterium]
MLQRVDRLRQRLKELGLDALLISCLTNIRYLFGFTGSNAIALVFPEVSYFLTDRRYTEQARQQVAGAEIRIAQHDLISELVKVARLQQPLRLGVEAEHLSLKHFHTLKKKLPKAHLVASERVVERLASVKEDDEVAHIRQAGEICARVFAEILPLLKVGVSELEISAELSYRTRRLGSERDPFEPIVASGKRSALPHGISSPKTLAAGDLLIIDFGATVAGYAADVTRTVVVGEASPKQHDMAAAVLDALTRAEHAARPGMTGRELDRVARAVLEERGFGKYFQHALGHGLGLEVHGLPRIGEQSRDPLEAGNVITLEPGVYLPELGGVRIEDDFVLTEAGVENLTPFPREFVCVG